MQQESLLHVENLVVDFKTYGGRVAALRGVGFDVAPGEVLAIVGESGSGKSVTCQAMMGLLPVPPGRVVGGRAVFQGADLLQLRPHELSALRGRDISMIFQDPLTSLNPTMTIGDQIAEVLVKHRKLSKKSALAETIEILRLVQIPEAERRLSQFPHEFSGGMRQRIMIAIALACRPKLLIADEPTTALDVTIQGQILELLKNLKRDMGMAIILITHDLGVVAQIADRVAVMYAGQIVETGGVFEIFKSPRHPYTVGLKSAIPNPSLFGSHELVSIPGSPPDLFSPPSGCGFAARCLVAMEVCGSYPPPVIQTPSGYARCWLHHSYAPADLAREVAIERATC
ncbi:oligopeptide transport ATP-binding protein OppD [Planctomyces bekefii]|uniref:Oligopeptide transport ATP-binding protein OppD n=1 Tax=Planctomyces bekefii TaxID=1653850 RepID=A0A5C6M9E1_9PLAN|nr:oligopeptide transport ATP-binding protein OppD [Planctomyces bekefii]